MQKILLILEDYSELMFIQIILKKLGFDVDGIQNPHAIPERLMTFRPQVVIAPEEGKRIRKDTLIQTLYMNPGLKIIFLSSTAGGKVEHLSDGNCRIKSPIQPVEMIQALGRVFGTDADVLLEKYKKFRKQLTGEKGAERILQELKDEESGNVVISTKAIAGENRSEKYDKFLQQTGDKVKNQFSPKDVTKQHQILRSSKDVEVDVQRQSFTEKLFKKKS